jgi:hypothetical protein
MVPETNCKMIRRAVVDLFPGQNPGQDDQAEVEKRHGHEGNGNHPGGDLILRAVLANHGQGTHQKTQKHGAGIAEVHLRRLPIEAQKAQTSSEEGRGQGGHKIVAVEDGHRQCAPGAHQPRHQRKPVGYVDDVEGVDAGDQPQHAEDFGSGEGQAADLHLDTGLDQHDGGHHLADELVPGGEGPQVIHQAHRDHQ